MSSARNQFSGPSDPADEFHLSFSRMEVNRAFMRRSFQRGFANNCPLIPRQWPSEVNLPREGCLQVDEPVHSRERELRALMTASLEGDANAYHELLERLSAHLRAYYRIRFVRVGRGPAEAEDLLQEALVALHAHRHTYDRLQPFTPWIHAIARYKFLDHLQRTKTPFKDIPLDCAEDLIANSDLVPVERGPGSGTAHVEIASKPRSAIQT
jgi:RNA polymerase sigma-70 factor, ECF subfamily